MIAQFINVALVSGSPLQIVANPVYAKWDGGGRARPARSAASAAAAKKLKHLLMYQPKGAI
jgi:hypothetical protein